MKTMHKHLIGLGMVALFGVSDVAGIDAPTDISGCVLWLDGDDLDGDGSAEGAGENYVNAGTATWVDKSGSGNDFASTAYPDQTLSLINGKAGLTFNGVDDHLTKAGGVLTAGDDDYTYYAVWRPHANSGARRVYEQQGTGIGTYAALLAVNAAYGFNGQGNDRHDLVPFWANVWRLTDMKVDNSLPDGVNNIYIDDNGTSYAGVTGNPAALNVGTTACTIGAKNGGANGEWLDGDLMEVIVYEGALSDTDRHSVRDYLQEKYGLLFYEFGDGMFQGWWVVAQGGGPNALVDSSWANRLGADDCITTARTVDGGGFTGDDAHSIIRVRSPWFTVDAGATEITWNSFAGHATATVDPGTGTGNYPDNAIGVSLVEAATGNRIMSDRLNQQGTVAGKSFNVSGLAGNGRTYYLEIVDNYSGDWGYGEWDDFVIPGTEVPNDPELLAYESFDYGVGVDNLDDDGSGGSGWSGGWIDVDGNGAGSDVISGSLAPSGDPRLLLTVGNAALQGNGGRIGRWLDTSTGGAFDLAGYLDANGNVGADGKTLYISFLAQTSLASDNFYEFEFKRDNLADPGRIAGIGNDVNNSTKFHLRQPTSGRNNPFADANTGVNFFVVRIDYSAGDNDDISVYMNPQLGTEPGTATKTDTGVGDLSLDGLSFGAYLNGITYALDEIRVGTTYASVTPAIVVSKGTLFIIK